MTTYTLIIIAIPWPMLLLYLFGNKKLHPIINLIMLAYFLSFSTAIILHVLHIGV